MVKSIRHIAWGALCILLAALAGCLANHGNCTASAAEASPAAVNGAEHESARDAFYISGITDDIYKRIAGRSYKENCPLPLEELRYIHVLHKDISGAVHEGEMVCNRNIAEKLIFIFKELYSAGYPIEKIRLVDEYGADDETSMRDNNSSCFNFRFISGTKKISKHGLGLAVDINTLYNPYVKEKDGRKIVEPATAMEYTDRTKDFPYKITKDDLCFKLFTMLGFEWGGDWKSLKDYQHFELPTEAVEKLYPQNR